MSDTEVKASSRSVDDYTPDTYTWTDAFINRILATMVQDVQLLASHRSALQAEYFEKEHHRVLGHLILEHFDKHTVPPDWGVLDNYVEQYASQRPNYGDFKGLKKLTRKIFELEVIGQVDHIKGEVVEFGRHQALKRMYIEGYASLSQPETYQTAMERVQAAMSVGQDTEDLGDFVFTLDSIKERNMWRKAFKTKRVPTGLADLDERLEGGGGGGEVLMLVAPTNSGKSTLATNIAVGAVEAQRKALYYTFEQSKKKIGTKMDCKVTGLTTSGLRAKSYKNIAKIPAMARYIANFSQNMLVKWFKPDTYSINDIRMHLAQVKAKGFIPDVIVIDSPDFMIPTIPIRDEWQALGHIYNAIFTLASELDIPIWVTSDTKQAAYGKAMTSVKDIGNSYKKARKVDVIIAVGATEQEHAAGFIRLYLAKVRDGGSKGQPVLVNMNWATSSWTTAVTNEEMKDRVEEFKKAQEAAEGKEDEEASKKGEETAKEAEVPGWKTPAQEAEDAKKAAADEKKKKKEEAAAKALEKSEEEEAEKE